MLHLSRSFLAVTLFVLFTLNSISLAQTELKSTGIGFRGSFFNTSGQSTGVIVRNHIGNSVNSSFNGGGCLYVFSRLSQKTLLEFTMGSISNSEQVSSYIGSNKVDVFSVTPILFGLRYDFLQTQNYSALQPYLSTGLGAYVLSDVKVKNEIMKNEVIASSEIKPGLYLGTGLNINLASWLALNIDGKYHLIKFNPNYIHSGFEFGVGFGFSWGSF